MAEYIEREALLEEIDRRFEESPIENTNAWMVGRRIVRKFPAADVEPVVHCKDCKWFNKSGCAIEIVDDSDMPNENDYCSFAERAFANGAKMDGKENEQ